MDERDWILVALHAWPDIPPEDLASQSGPGCALVVIRHILAMLRTFWRGKILTDATRELPLIQAVLRTDKRQGVMLALAATHKEGPRFERWIETRDLLDRFWATRPFLWLMPKIEGPKTTQRERTTLGLLNIESKAGTPMTKLVHDAVQDAVSRSRGVFAWPPICMRILYTHSDQACNPLYFYLNESKTVYNAVNGEQPPRLESQPIETDVYSCIARVLLREKDAEPDLVCIYDGRWDTWTCETVGPRDENQGFIVNRRYMMYYFRFKQADWEEELGLVRGLDS